jgi:hypothetical protein
LEFIKDFPELNFIPGNINMWSPYRKAVTYDSRQVNTNNGKLGLLHEISHGLLGHRIYKYDIELINMEMDAWDLTRKLARKYSIRIDERHIARCIESYDRWMTKRATCPDCNNFSLQKGRDKYGCFACGSIWDVNWRKDRRVTRRIMQRWEHPLLAGSSPA